MRSKKEQASSPAKIAENPRNYIAQPTPGAVACPTIVDGGFEGRHVDLRPYILYGRESSCCRRSDARRAQEGIAGRQFSQGGGSKDTWVLAGDPRVDTDRPSRYGDGHHAPGAAVVMLSRVAESIYWMTRYIERAENVARFVDVNLNLMLDFPGSSISSGSRSWTSLAIRGFQGTIRRSLSGLVIRFLTFDTKNSNSILSCVRAARENARSVREIISSSMWEHLNQSYLMLTAAASRRREISDPHELFSSVKTASQAFTGITDTTMTHNEGWHFCRLGRQLERADKTSRILDVKYFSCCRRWTTSARRWTMCSGRRCCARRAPSRCITSATAAFRRPASSNSSCSTSSSRARIHHSVKAARESVHAITGTRHGDVPQPGRAVARVALLGAGLRASG
jgi:hypothetical protein